MKAHSVVDVQTGPLGSLKYICSCGEFWCELPDGPGSLAFRISDGRQEQIVRKCPKANAKDGKND